MSNKKYIGAVSLGLTYAGCFFGAGYVSGNELYEFFGSFGVKGYLGLIFSVVLFWIFGVLLVRNVKLSDKTSFDEVIIIKDYKLPRLIVGAITIFMMFGIYVIMAAGAGALANRVFDIPDAVGCAVFVFVVSIVSFFGINGIVKVFSTIIPLLVVSTLIICGIALYKYGINFDLPMTNKNPLLINWFFSSITYVSYNMVTLIGTMIPVGKLVNKNSTIFSGIAFGCIAAISIAMGILMAVTSIFGAAQEELPMLDIAFKIGSGFGIIYAILLLLAMFGTSLSSIVALNVYAYEKSPVLNKHKIIFTVLVSVLTFIFSLQGFGNLVNTVYPVFGYIGFIILIIIIVNNIILNRKNKSIGA